MGKEKESDQSLAATNTGGRDCSANSFSLCGCSRLLRLGLIASFDDCTRGAAMEACVAGTCFFDSYSTKEKESDQSLAATITGGRDCSAHSFSLCGCSRLLRLGLIASFDDCTRGAAMEACVVGTCFFGS